MKIARAVWLIAFALAALGLLPAQELVAPSESTNHPDRVERFRDFGFGLFIHWNVDSTLGTVISHSLVSASEDYIRRYYAELPGVFNPRAFQPDDWAGLAKLAGVKYVVFTAKHHSGFCMFDTATTDFGIMHTPFQRDVTAEVLQAFRRQGIATGIYFSPDDFLWLHRHGITIQRGVPGVQPSHNPGLRAYDEAQVTELLTHYGPVDVFFIDGEADALRTLAWRLQPQIVVTRGAMPTPELHTMDKPLDEAWESCITMSTAWQYQPTLDVYKTGRQCLSLLIQTRAEGGNLLLDIGPKPNGELPQQQEDRLREMALWMFANGECIYGVRPWIITHEKDVWFTRRKAERTVYAIVDRDQEWAFGAWGEVVLKSVRATPRTVASVLGQNDQVLEYRPDVIPTTTWRQGADGLHIRAMRTQRMRDNHHWPDPLVLKLTEVEPALTPPQVETVRASATAGGARLEGRLESLGDSAALPVVFAYQDVTGKDTHEAMDDWRYTDPQTLSAPGNFSATVAGLSPGRTYEVRVVVRHPLANFYGDEIRFETPAGAP